MDLEPEALPEGLTWITSLKRSCYLPGLAVIQKHPATAYQGKNSQELVLRSSSLMEEDLRQISLRKLNSNHGLCVNKSRALYFLQTFSMLTAGLPQDEKLAFLKGFHYSLVAYLTVDLTQKENSFLLPDCCAWPNCCSILYFLFFLSFFFFSPPSRYPSLPPLL